MSNFSRSQGNRVGIKQNLLQAKKRQVVTLDDTDLYFATAAKLNKGRIDKPVLVSIDNFIYEFGQNLSIRKDLKYKSALAVYDGLKYGAAGCVVQRLMGPNPKNLPIVAKTSTDMTLDATIRDGIIDTISVSNAGSGYLVPSIVLTDPSGADGLEKTTVLLRPMNVNQMLVIGNANENLVIKALQVIHFADVYKLVNTIIKYFDNSVNFDSGHLLTIETDITIAVNGNFDTKWNATQTTAAGTDQGNNHITFVATSLGNKTDLTVREVTNSPVDGGAILNVAAEVVKSLTTGSQGNGSTKASFNYQIKPMVVNDTLMFSDGGNSVTITSKADIAYIQIDDNVINDLVNALNGAASYTNTNFTTTAKTGTLPFAFATIVNSNTTASPHSLLAQFKLTYSATGAHTAPVPTGHMTEKPIATTVDGFVMPSYEIELDSNGSVRSLVLKGGSGWGAGTMLAIQHANGDSITRQALATIANPTSGGYGAGTSAVITDIGAGYAVPTVAVTDTTFFQSGGRGYSSPAPIFSVTLNSNGTIKSIQSLPIPQLTLTNASQALGFQTGDSLTVSAPKNADGSANTGGTTATASVNAIKNGVIIRLNIRASDNGITFTPNATLSVNFNSSAGTGAVAQLKTNYNGEIVSIPISSGGSGYATVTVAATVTQANNIECQLNALTDPSFPAQYLFYLQLLDCDNNGAKIGIHADAKKVGATAVPNEVVTVVINDSNNVTQYVFTGSLNQNAKQPDGSSFYLPDVISAETDAVVCVMGTLTSIPVNSDAYGFVNGTTPKFSWSQVLKYFTPDEPTAVDGTGKTYTVYSADDYDRACELLAKSEYGYGCLINADNTDTAFVQSLYDLSYRKNVPLFLDLPYNSGVYSRVGAVCNGSGVNENDSNKDYVLDWLASFDTVQNQASSYLVKPILNLLKRIDSLNQNPKDFYGMSGVHAGLTCGRNSITQDGISKKQQAIMGALYALQGEFHQYYYPSDDDLEDFAGAGINLVRNFGNIGFVFSDNLTRYMSIGGRTDPRSFATVIDMSTWIENQVIDIENQMLGQPIDVAVRTVTRLIDRLMQKCNTAGWFTNSGDIQLAGKAYKITVKKDAIYSIDKINTTSLYAPQGTVRQFENTTTVTY